ncbi:uncharacterized protein P174DRAFT_57613 [Aspergillus novofumigatus IBT 16806]|uniref:Uncharacterized protein n=1 Tax=Aspergillus novofumigatus (strain IBT 16806) TaxID=1392255 RepID=A0A2I1BVL2_ASPN1|nr:uncharacterized protein P174DRAFT_57613 [Aspergillus novofumigatus IBT 16806]PKX89409.1 hypothetical protein P174DRAFT_57613 [Aspergillus novofumigatus IBT 16806]
MTVQRERRTCTQPRNNREPKSSLSIHNISIQRIRYSIRRPPRKGNSSTWPSDWNQSVHIIHSEAGSQTKQSNIHDPSSPLEAGLVLHLKVQYGPLLFGSVRLLPGADMAAEVGIAPEGEGNYQVIRQNKLYREGELQWLSTYYPCCGCCG